MVLLKETGFSSLIDVLLHRAAEQGNTIVFTFLKDGEIEETSLTFSELNNEAIRVAVTLQSKFDSGDRVLLAFPAGLEFVIAFIGCLYAGIIAVPIASPRYKKHSPQLLSILNNSKAKALLSTSKTYLRIKETIEIDAAYNKLPVFNVDDFEKADLKRWQKPEISDDTIAFLQYTSGSTGNPKGIMVGHSNIMHNAEYIKHIHHTSEKSVAVTWIPNFHDMGLIDGIIQPIYTGFKSYLMSPASFLRRPVKWLNAISKYQATHCGGPNFAYDLCVQKITSDEVNSLNLSSWNNAYCGAEVVRKKTIDGFVEKFKKCGFKFKSFHPCFGLAETTLVATGGIYGEEPVVCSIQAEALKENKIVEVTEDSEKRIELLGNGRAWDTMKVEIVDAETHEICPIDQVGEVWISGPSVTKGYWGLSDETKKIFQACVKGRPEEFYFRTGDLGFIKNETLFIVGRLKEAIIIRGQNFYPNDIEVCMHECHSALKGSAQAAFAADVDGEERLLACCEVKKEYVKNLDVKDIASAIRLAVWEAHDVQVYGVLLLKPDSIPQTTSGKIKRSECREKFLNDGLDIIEKHFILK